MRVAAETLKEVFNELPNYNILIPVILKEVQTFYIALNQPASQA